MKMRIAVAFSALVLGVVAPISSVLAFDYERPQGRYTGFAPYDPQVTGSFGFPGNRNPGTCPMSSAAEGNAEQQNFPVKQYGRTSGGNRC